MAKIIYIRCPVCGKASRIANFQAGEKGDHSLDLLEQVITCNGQKGGIKNTWSKKAYSPDILYAITEIVRKVSVRLRLLMGVSVARETMPVFAFARDSVFSSDIKDNVNASGCRESVNLSFVGGVK